MVVLGLDEMSSVQEFKILERFKVSEEMVSIKQIYHKVKFHVLFCNEAEVRRIIPLS